MQINLSTPQSGKTLDQIKSEKVAALDTSCNLTILGNFPFIVNGTLYYFPNDDTAQKNFDKFLLAFSSGLANEPENFTCYDVNGKVCRVAFNAKSYLALYRAHLLHIASNITLFRDYLEPKVDNCASADEVNAINWLTLLFGQTQVSVSDSSEMDVALSLEGTLLSEVTAAAELS